MAIEASPYGGLTDEELLVLSRTRPDAFGTFYERHAEPLLAFFARRTFDPEIAAELTAETFAQAFAGRRRFEKRGAAGAGWLYATGSQHTRRRWHEHGDRVSGAARGGPGGPRRAGVPPRAGTETAPAVGEVRRRGFCRGPGRCRPRRILRPPAGSGQACDASQAASP